MSADTKIREGFVRLAGLIKQRGFRPGGTQGQVLANPGANSVVVADFADNLARVRALISRIDVDRSSYDVVPLENASTSK